MTPLNKVKQFYMKYLLIYCLILFASVPVFSQTAPMGGNQFVKVQQLKIGFMTNELNLTAEEAQKFWPVYNAYSKESSQARKDNKEDIIVLDEMLLNIKKKYTGEFKKILGTDQRANKVFVSERNFGNVIRKEMENRQKLRQQQRLEALPNN
jgi:Spy/CpxP family protein refolding chaperone